MSPVPEWLFEEIARAKEECRAAVARLEAVSGLPKERWVEPDDEARALLAREPGVLAAHDERQRAIQAAYALMSQAHQLIDTWSWRRCD